MWGANGDAQLGNGTLTSQAVPLQVGTGANWAKVAAGPFTTFAVGTDGLLWGWGRNAEGQQGNGTVGTAVVTPTAIP